MSVRRHRDVLVQPLDDDLVMADLESGHYYGLADTAKRIWTLVEEPTSVASICAQLTREYAVESTVCESDVIEFLNALLADKLLHIVV